MMNLFPESLEFPAGRAVLLSIKPRYADLILAGTKRVELRRSWPATEIGVMVLYSSAPIQRLVGVAYIDYVNETDVASLWDLACQFGGGLTQEELLDYFHGKKTAYGIIIKGTRIAQHPVDPNEIFPNFTPPQSFQYITPEEFRRIMRTFFPDEY